MTKPNNYALCPRCGVGLGWRSARITDPRCPVCPPDAAPPERVPFEAVRSRLRLSLDREYSGVSPTAETARIAADFIYSRTSPEGFRRWFLKRLGQEKSVRVSTASWLGGYLSSVLPGLPIWVKDVGGRPGAYVAGDCYGTRVGPPGWLADWMRAAEAAGTVRHGRWFGAPKTVVVLTRDDALRLLDRLPPDTRAAKATS